MCRSCAFSNRLAVRRVGQWWFSCWLVASWFSDVHDAKKGEGLLQATGERLVRKLGIVHGPGQLQGPDDHREEDERPAMCRFGVSVGEASRDVVDQGLRACRVGILCHLGRPSDLVEQGCRGTTRVTV